jgi:hypothetical protein
MSNESDTSEKRSWLDPYASDQTVKAAALIFVGTLLLIIMARAPGIELKTLFGLTLPFPINAIIAILIAPPCLAVATWLLYRAAVHSQRVRWAAEDLIFVGILFFLAAIASAVIWLQFFLVLAPYGKCDPPPGFALLWTSLSDPTPAQHCMFKGRSLEGWYYIEPIWLQAWLNTVLTAISIFFVYKAWSTWKAKRI